MNGIREQAGTGIAALIYVRVSTEEQADKGYSLEGQTEDCLRKAEEMGYSREKTVVIRDEASGASMDRPGLNRLREWVASAARPECVILYDPDRLARRLAHQLILTEEIVKRKVSLEFVNFTWNNTPEGRMFYQLRGMFAEFEREKIRERTMRGRLAKIKHYGKLSCDPRLYGYRFDTGEDVLKVEAFEAATVRWMFERAAEGLSCGEIAAQLKEEGRLAPRGSVWYPSTVSRILRNRSYLGTYMAYKVDYHQGYRRVRSAEEQFPLAIEPVITEQQYLQAQSQLNRRIRQGGRPLVRKRLLAEVAVCSCGTPMVTVSASRGRIYYRCPAAKIKAAASGKLPSNGKHAPSSECAGSSYWNADAVDERIWETVRSYLSENLKVRWEELREIAAGASEDSVANPSAFPRDAKRLTRLAKLRERRARLLELYLSDAINRQEFDCKADELEKEIAKLTPLPERLDRVGIEAAERPVEAREDASGETELLFQQYDDALEQADEPSKRAIIRELVAQAVFEKSRTIRLIFRDGD